MHPERARSATEPLRHVAVPYDSDAAFLRLVGPRVRAALDEGRRVLAVLDDERLDLLGDDAERLDRRDPALWYAHPARTMAAQHEYARGRRTMIVGEPVWEGRSERELREWIRYESVLNAALGDASAIALCLYDLRAVPPEALGYCPVSHPYVLERPSSAFVAPQDLVLDGDRAPLPPPAGPSHALDFTARELRRVREAVDDFADAAGMEGGQVTSLVLSVSEIAANSVEHGAGHGTLTMWTESGEMIVEIADPGGTLDDPLPGYIPPEPESPRGYGLWISRQLCDLVEVRSQDGALRVRLHMDLDGNAPGW